jgi:hypothetical protein
MALTDISNKSGKSMRRTAGKSSGLRDPLEGSSSG